MNHLVFEVGIALVLVALGSIVATKLKFSIIPFLIIFGIVFGTYVPEMGIINLTFTHSNDIIQFLGRIGVLFLLFSLGLEFSVGKLMKSGRNIVVGGSILVAINFVLGIVYGIIVGMPWMEVLIIAGVLSVSSSAIVAKVLVDLKRTANPETELILGIVLFDDLFLALFLATISGILLTESASVFGILSSVLISVGYILLFFVIARKGTKLLNKWLNIKSNEIFIIVIFAILFFVAGFSEILHVAEAIGALLLGLVFSETEHRKRIEQLIVPFRDFFGALFFFSFGLNIDPSALGSAIWLALGAAILTIVGNVVAGMISGRRAGLSYESSTSIGLTIMARGEFSIIVANLGITAGLDPILTPFTALYVLILAISGPLMTKESKVIFNGLNQIYKWKKELKSKVVGVPKGRSTNSI
jgi:monovalent cation:H+ antiporter-2, CPA2 family